MARTYRVTTQGIQAGFARERAEARLMLLFKRPLSGVQGIVNGQGAVLKRGLDSATARRFRDMLVQCGCACEIEEEEAPPVVQPTIVQYVPLLVEQLRALDPGREWRFDEAALTLTSDPGPYSPYPLELVVSVDRLYSEWLVATDGGRQDILRYSAGVILMGNSPAVLQEVKQHLLPIIRNSADRGQAMLMAARGYSPLVYRPLVDGLEIGLAYDRNGSVIRVAQGHLDAWGMDESEAFDIALANLRTRSELSPRFIGKGVHVGDWDDDYDISRILLTDMMQATVAEGRPVVMIPARGRLLICSDESSAGMAEMLKRAIEVMRDERIISPAMLRLVDGKWQVYKPRAHARRLNSLHKYSMGEDYSNQKELLQSRANAAGDNVYVATYLIGKTGPEQVRTSACTWTRGISSLLPRTDLLCFSDADGDGEGNNVTVPWEAAQPIVGALMQQTKDSPPRYIVTTYPNAMQMDQLKQAARNARLAKVDAVLSKRVPAKAPEPQRSGLLKTFVAAVTMFMPRRA